MQFKIPQFIDIEDKILGPLTWKQFAYCLGAVGCAYLAFRFTDTTFMAILVGGPFVGLFLALAFVKINNQSFIEFIEHVISYYSKNNIYTWQNKDNINTNNLNIPKGDIFNKSVKLNTKVEEKDFE